MPFKDPLDTLLEEALAQQSRRKIKAQPERGDKRLAALRESFKALYENPDNWERKRGIALIHRSDDGTQTLLGNFTEFLHKRRNARKLIREAQPLLIDVEEFVSGSWWVADRPQMKIADRNNWEIRETALNISLAELHVVAEAVMIRVFLQNNWIARVELVEQTPFHCPVNSQVLYLPAGCDILEGMDLQTKLELRKQMGL